MIAIGMLWIAYIAIREGMSGYAVPPLIAATTCALAAFATYIDLNHVELRIRNLGFESTVPLQNIDSVDPDYWGLVIKDHTGTVSIAMAIQESNLMNKFFPGRSRASRVAREIEALARATQDRPDFLA